MASSPVHGPTGVREGRAQVKSDGRFHHASAGCPVLLAPAVKEILQSRSIHRFLASLLARRAAGTRVPESAGRGLDVAARAACLGVGGQDKAVGEDDRAGGLVRAARLVAGMNGGGLGGGGELSLAGAWAHVA